MTTPTFQPTGSGHPGAGDSEASSALASPVRRRALCFGAAALGAAALAPVGLVRAQSLGDRPLRIILPLSAGSGADGSIRAISNSLAKALGQPVVIENLPGAGGITGTTQIVRAHEPARRLFTAALERNRDEWMLRLLAWARAHASSRGVQSPDFTPTLRASAFSGGLRRCGVGG